MPEGTMLKPRYDFHANDFWPRGYTGSYNALPSLRLSVEPLNRCQPTFGPSHYDIPLQSHIINPPERRAPGLIVRANGRDAP